MKIAVIGTGYVGLVTGACLAEFGWTVACVDRDAAKIAQLRAGAMPIFEPGLDEVVARNVDTGRLRFTTDLAEAVRATDVVFIAVGTPSRRGDGHSDLSYVYAAAREIAAAVNGHKVVVVKSTVPVGTCEMVERVMREVTPTADISVASNPEFLRQGAAVEDFQKPDRVVVGVGDARAQEMLADLYRPLSAAGVPIVFTDRRSSELIKYAANALLATKIAFINEMADLCERVGADVLEISRGIGLDRRIGPKFLAAGPGFGGSCFPKDTTALIKTANDVDFSPRIVSAVATVNEERKRAMGRKVIKVCGGDVRGQRIAVLGLTFKPNTDDMRESPAIAIVQALIDVGAIVRAYDPEGMENARAIMDGVEFAEDAYACLEDAEAMVLVTEWDEFRKLDFAEVKRRLKTPRVVDLRNIYPPSDLIAQGFVYVGVGRGRYTAEAVASA
jgi:UDPglucose 6-dehydrogenase